MRIENHTNLDTSEIKARFKEASFGIKTGNVLVEIHNSNRHHITGRVWFKPIFYQWNRRWTRKHKQHIYIGVPKTNPVITWRQLGRGQERTKIELSRIDALTLTFAHELYHIVQYRERRSLSQIEADQFAVSIGQRLGIIGGD